MVVPIFDVCNCLSFGCCASFYSSSASRFWRYRRRETQSDYKKAAPWDEDPWRCEAIIDGTELVWRAGNKATEGFSASMAYVNGGLVAQLRKTEGI
jgi:hypothetical protein